MSRGLGQAQRFVLDELERHEPGIELSAYDLAWARGGYDKRYKRWKIGPNRAEVQTMRNAIRRFGGDPRVKVNEPHEESGIYENFGAATGKSWTRTTILTIRLAS